MSGSDSTTSSSPSLRERVLDTEGRFDERTLERIFTLVILAIPTTFVVVAMTYDSTSRLFPTIVGVPAILIQVVVLGMQFSPRLRDAVSRVDVGAGGGFGEEFGAESEPGSEVAPPDEQRSNLLSMVGWLCALVALIYVTGYVVGILLFLLSIYQVNTDASRLRGVVYALVIWLFVIVVFVVVLNAPLYQGLLGISPSL